MLFICLVAAGLRFWQLGDAPPGLYRDEAYNGLDALSLLEGQHALFFTQNNGREPLYIYLTSAAIAIFGQTAYAVRVAAAVVGTLTTIPVYFLARSWFDDRTGFFAAWLWATTVWPIHLSRIGLRAVLLVPLVTMAFWLATRAWRAQVNVRRPVGIGQPQWLWLTTGLISGLATYTYLPSRLLPVIGSILIFYLYWRRPDRFPWIGLFWAIGGWIFALLPWGWLLWSQPEILLGRTEQVSIFNEAINKGDFWGTLWRHGWRTLGLFLWQGDMIIRHNPPGRPLFDPFMAIPFLWGVWSVGRQWQKPISFAILIWLMVMLSATVLAEDAPHFLRAVGILPVALFFPAVGLSQIASWPRLEGLWRPYGTAVMVIIIICGSLWFTYRDYFENYVWQPDTAYLFEAAARDLAEQMNAEEKHTTIYLERRFWEGWSSIPFLTEVDAERLHLVDRDSPLPSELPTQAALYVWPHDRQRLAEWVTAVPATVRLSARPGSLARGDLQPDEYLLYLRYRWQPLDVGTPQATFRQDGVTVQLLSGTADIEDNQMTVELLWQSIASSQPLPNLTTFVHVLDTETGQLVAQSDQVPGQGWLPTEWWPSQGQVTDHHRLPLTSPLEFEEGRYQVLVGMYPSGQPTERFFAIGLDGEEIGTTWQVNEGWVSR